MAPKDETDITEITSHNTKKSSAASGSTSTKTSSNISISNSSTSDRSTANRSTSNATSNATSNQMAAKRQSQVPFWCKKFVMSFQPQQIVRNLVERIYWDVTVDFRTDRQIDKRRNKDSQDRRPHRNRYLDKHIFRVNTIRPHTSDNGNIHKSLLHDTIRILKREWSLLRPPRCTWISSRAYWLSIPRHTAPFEFATRGELVRLRKGSPVQWP